MTDPRDPTPTPPPTDEQRARAREVVHTWAPLLTPGPDQQLRDAVASLLAAEREAGRVEGRAEDPVTGLSDTCAYLRDGTKITVGRDRRTTGPAWLKRSPQATLRPCTGLVDGDNHTRPDGGDHGSEG